MSRTSSILESFPVEGQLKSVESLRAFRTTYDRTRGVIERIARQARVREAAARGWIHLPSKKRRSFTPLPLPGRPLSQLLSEVRD